MPGIDKLFRTKPFFWIGVPLFFLLKNIDLYFGYIPADQWPLLFARYLLGSVALYLLLYKFIGIKAYKAALYCLIILSLYFFFTAFDNFIQGQTWLNPINRYRYFLPLLALCIIAAIYYISRMSKPPFRAILFFNLLLSIFCTIEVVQIVYKFLYPPKALLGIEKQVTYSATASEAAPYPDIYFLLFDEYQGNEGLQKSFGYDNAPLLQALKADSFYIPKLSRSNYNYTFFSMPSIFNMSYLTGDIQGRNDQENTLKMAAGIKLIEHTALIDFFKQNKYRIVNLSPFAVEPGGTKISGFRTINFERDLILTQTIWYTLAKKFGRGFLPDKLFVYLSNPADYNSQYYNTYIRDHLIYASETAAKTGPSFIYAHFLMPHTPLMNDSTGQIVSWGLQMKATTPEALNALYLGYLKYTNTVLRTVLEKIIQNDPHALIIVMSDHGFRNGQPTEFNNQFSIRIPGAYPTHWPDTIDAVNAFRLVLNDRFGQKLDYLPYRSVHFDLIPQPGVR